MQGEESGAREEHHRHQEEPLVTAPARHLTHDQAERDVQERDAEHEPEMRRMVLPMDVKGREAQERGQPGQRDGERDDEVPGKTRFGAILRCSHATSGSTTFTPSAHPSGGRVLLSGCDRDHDVADLLPRLDIPVRLDDLLERIRPVDDGLEGSGLQQPREESQLLLAEPGWDRHRGRLAAEKRCEQRKERVLGQRAEVRGRLDPSRFEQSLALPERALADRVQDDVVSLLVQREVVERCSR